jgi:hypothetical protein
MKRFICFGLALAILAPAIGSAEAATKKKQKNGPICPNRRDRWFAEEHGPVR